MSAEEFLIAASIAIVLSAVVVLVVLFCYRTFLLQLTKNAPAAKKQQTKGDGITLVYLE